MDILEQIVGRKRIEIAETKRKKPERVLLREAERLTGKKGVSLSDALRKSPTGIIAEFKRRSPSKGWIKEEGRADIIPLSYQRNGAAALSILTDETFFGGSDRFVKEARESGVTLPILYKNFIIDEYQLFQALLSGASAVLLIAACLRKDECRRLLSAAHAIGLEALLEMHSEEETDYCDLEPDVCGINNRNLGSFVTDTAVSLRLIHLLPKDAVKVSESGIGDPSAVNDLRRAGFNGFLIGERFMRTADPGKALNEFIKAST